MAIAIAISISISIFVGNVEVRGLGRGLSARSSDDLFYQLVRRGGHGSYNGFAVILRNLDWAPYKVSSVE